MKNNGYVIALDIGGTKIEGALVDKNIQIVKKDRIYLDKKKSDNYVKTSLSDLLKCIDEMVIGLLEDKKMDGIGISFPGTILKNNRISGLSKIVAFSNLDLGDILSKKYKVPAVLANDADCFALAEQRLGAAKGCDNVVGVIIGTGVGSGIILNGKIYSGTYGSAGEFGRNIVNPSGPKDRAGLSGTVEAYAGGPQIVLNYYGSGGKMKDAGPREIFNSKDKAAKKVVDDWYTYLGIGIAGIMHVISPAIFVMGGGLSNLPIYRELNKKAKENASPIFRKFIKIVKHRLGDSAGVYGAAILAFELSKNKN